MFFVVLTAIASSQYSSSCNKGGSNHACETMGAPDVALTCADEVLADPDEHAGGAGRIYAHMVRDLV